MFRFLLLSLLYLSTTNLHAQLNQWRRVKVPSEHGFLKIETHKGRGYAIANHLKGIFTSDDEGKNWVHRWEGKGFFINPYNNAFFRIDLQNKLFRSDNDGFTWQEIDAAPLSLDFYPTLSFQGDTIFASVGTQLYKHRPNTPWELIYQNPAGTGLKNCIVSANHIWLDKGLGYDHSEDYGQTWTTLSLGVLNTRGMAASGDTMLFYFEGFNFSRQIACTKDFGQTFQTQPTPIFFEILSERIHPFLAQDPEGNWYASTNGFSDWTLLWSQVGDYISNDIVLLNGKPLVSTINGVLHENAGAWEYGWHGLQPLDTTVDLRIRQIGPYLLCRQIGGATGFSTDKGDTWQRGLSGWMPEQIQEVGNYYIGVEAFRIIRCLKNNHFDWKVPIEPYAGFQLKHLTSLSDTLYCNGGEIYRATDTAAGIWTQTGSLYLGDYQIFFGFGGELFSRSDSSLLISQDGGATWSSRYDFGFPITPSVSRVFELGGSIFVSQTGLKEIFVSHDSGHSFQPLTNLPLPDGGTVFQLRLYGSAMLLNTWNSNWSSPGSIYFSNDKGENWLDLGKPQLNFAPGFISSAGVMDSTIFVIGGGNDLWRMDFGGNVSNSVIPNPKKDAETYFSVFPNPISKGQKTYISLQNDFYGEVMFEVLNIYGGQISQSKTIKTSFTHQLELSDWIGTGVFMVRARFGTQYYTSVIVKE
jgi:hypothetical protein